MYSEQEKLKAPINQ
jgi:hypothetical protein